MYTTTVRSVAAIRFLEEGSHNVKMKQLIGHEDGARKTAMHELIITKGGFSAMHRHEWDHQLVVTEGRGVAILDGKKLALRPGVVLLVQSNEEHQFLQRGREPLKFVTVTPIRSGRGPSFIATRPFVRGNEARSHGVHRLRASPSGPRAVWVAPRTHVPSRRLHRGRAQRRDAPRLRGHQESAARHPRRARPQGLEHVPRVPNGREYLRAHCEATS